MCVQVAVTRSTPMLRFIAPRSCSKCLNRGTDATDSKMIAKMVSVIRLVSCFLVFQVQNRNFQIGKTVENWKDAQNVCSNFGADLASIHNQKAITFSLQYLLQKHGHSGKLFRSTAGRFSRSAERAVSWSNKLRKGRQFWLDWWNCLGLRELLLRFANFMICTFTGNIQGFPVNGLGDCVAMDTAGSTSGEWVNTDCSSTLSVACVRKR